MNDTDKLIKDQFDSLPLEVREAITRIPWRDRVQGIAKRERLDEEKSSALETETLLILYGFASPDDFLGSITKELGLDAESSKRISDEVFDEIVTDIEKQFEMIEALHPKTKPSSEPTPPKPATPIPPAPTAPASTPVPISLTINRPIPKPSLNKITFEPKLPEIMPERELMVTSAPKVIPVATPTFRPATIPAPAAPAETITPVTAIPKPTEEVVSNVKLYIGGKDPYREPLE